MADYSLGYGGVGSGMDITGMVEQLVAADRKPADNRLNRIESQAKFKLSAIGTVSSAFSTLDTALKALKSATAFDTRTVKSGTDTVVGASVLDGALLDFSEIGPDPSLAAFEDAHIETADALSVNAVFTTRMGFQDDVEFVFNPSTQQIHFRSRSRVGLFDFGKNRSRMQIVSERFAQAAPR